MLRKLDGFQEPDKPLVFISSQKPSGPDWQAALSKLPSQQRRASPNCSITLLLTAPAVSIKQKARCGCRMVVFTSRAENSEQRSQSPPGFAASVTVRQTVFTDVVCFPTASPARLIDRCRRPDGTATQGQSDGAQGALVRSPSAPLCRMMKLLSRCLEQSFFGDPTKPILTCCSGRDVQIYSYTDTYVRTKVTPMKQTALIAGYFASMGYSEKPVESVLNPQITERSSPLRRRTNKSPAVRWVNGIGGRDGDMSCPGGPSSR